MARKVRFRAGDGKTYRMDEDFYNQEVSNGKKYELLGYADEAPVGDPAAGTVTTRDPVNDLPITKPAMSKAPQGLLRFVGPTGEEKSVSASDPYGAKELEGLGYKPKYDRLDALGHSALGSSLFNFGEEAASGAGALVTKLLGPASPDRPSSYGDFKSALVKGRQESSDEYPGAAALGNVVGGTAGSPVPGGPLAKEGTGGLMSALRLFLRGEGAAALSGAGGTEGGVTDRLKGAGESAMAAAPIMAGMGAVGAPWARKPDTMNVDPLKDELSKLRPWTYGNSEILRNEGGKARVASFRSSPGAYGDLAEKVSRDMPRGTDPNSALIKFGRDLNELPSSEKVPGALERLLGIKQKPMLTNEQAPVMLRTLIQESDKSGRAVGAAEQMAAGRGAAVDTGEFMSKVRRGPVAKLTSNRTDAPARARQADRVLNNAQAAVVPTPGATVVQVPSVPVTGMADTVKMLRQKAKEEGASIMGGPANRYGQSVGQAYDEAAGIGNGMQRDAALSVMSPAEQAQYLADRNRFRLTESGEGTVNALKATGAAPYSVGSEIAGGAGAQIGATLSPPGSAGLMGVLGARIGRLLGRSRHVFPNKANAYTRAAEALEGNPTTIGGIARAAPIQMAQRAPDALDRVIANEVGNEDSPEWIQAYKQRIAKNVVDKFLTRGDQ